MADLPTPRTASVGVAPLTDEVFLDDRRKFWSFFTGLVTKATIGLAVLLILLTIFLV